MEIENGAFAKKEVFWVSGSGFPAEADVVVEIDGVEPRLDVFASLGVLPNVFAKKGATPATKASHCAGRSHSNRKSLHIIEVSIVQRDPK